MMPYDASGVMLYQAGYDVCVLDGGMPDLMMMMMMMMMMHKVCVCVCGHGA
jgi:hypothetical protein